jgi:exopolyphosphatase/guanosine-5'-triphosphate,3'-diphosphate pyrophosphatase
MTFAVIDCGTNVFNLLIGEMGSDGLKILTTHKISVQLFKGAQKPNYIPEARMYRGIDAINSFHHTLKSLEIGHIKCVATSAVRDAENGQEFVSRVREIIGIHIEVIGGEEEAKLIYSGVEFSGLLDERKTLLIDIGGGSVEFTLCNKGQIHATLSLPIGVSRLKEMLHHAERLEKNELISLKNYLRNHTTELASMVKGVKIERCIGTSGSFDTLFKIFRSSVRNEASDKIMGYDIFEQIHEWILRLSLEDRLKDPRILPERAEYLPYATALISFILELTGPLSFEHCAFNLKEGLAAKYAEELGRGVQ